jgi:hypothetical protein
MQNWQVNSEVQRRNIVRRLPRCKGSELGGEWGGARVQIGRFKRIGRRIGWENGAILSGELGISTGQYWEVNWEVKRFRIGRGTGVILAGELGGSRMKIGRFDDVELGGGTVLNWEVQLCNISRRIGRSNDAELGGETMQNWQANWEVQRCNIVRRIGNFTVQYWEANWEAKRCRIGRTVVQI